MNAAASLTVASGMHASSRASATPAFSSSGNALSVKPMNLQCAKASLAKSRAAASATRSAAPVSDATMATASIQHRRSSVDLLGGGLHGAVVKHHAADVGRDNLVNRSDLFDGLDQRLQQLRVGAVRRENPELASREGFGTRQNAQRRGRGKLLPSRARGLRRIGHFKPQAVSHARRERNVDV